MERTVLRRLGKLYTRGVYKAQTFGQPDWKLYLPACKSLLDRGLLFRPMAHHQTSLHYGLTVAGQGAAKVELLSRKGVSGIEETNRALPRGLP